MVATHPLPDTVSLFLSLFWSKWCEVVDNSHTLPWIALGQGRTSSFLGAAFYLVVTFFSVLFSDVGTLSNALSDHAWLLATILFIVNGIMMDNHSKFISYIRTGLWVALWIFPFSSLANFSIYSSLLVLFSVVQCWSPVLTFTVLFVITARECLYESGIL
jgi:hypothetical protein